MHIHCILSDKGSDVASISPHETAFEAARVMAERNIGSLLVVERNRILGIISERDLARAMSIVRDVGDLHVSQVMTRELVTCHPTDTIDTVMAAMTTQRVRHVPVVDDNGRLCGMVSIGDVVKRRLDELASEAAALQEYIAIGR